MSERRAPALRLVVFVLILTLTVALATIAGCKKEEPAGGGAAVGRAGAGGRVGALAAAGGRRGGRQMRGRGSAAAGPAAAGMRGGVGPVGGRGGRRGRAAAAETGAKAAPGAGGAKPTTGVMMTAAQVPVSTKGATTGIPEVDKMAKIRDFAAVFGATTLIKAQDSNGTELEWIAVTPDSGKEKGQQVVLPLSMLMSADYPEVLEGYFPIYVRAGRQLGKIVSKATVTALRRPKKDIKAIREEESKKKGPAVQAQGAAAARSAAGGIGGRVGRGRGGGGMGRRAGGRGPRGGRF